MVFAMRHPNRIFSQRFQPEPATSNAQPPLWEHLRLPSSLWWMEDLLELSEQPGQEIIYITIPATVFQAVLRLPGGVNIWNDLMASWDSEDYFLMGDAEFGPPAPIGLTLDFENVDFSNQHLDGIDLRHAWLNNSNFSGASLKQAQFDFASITATNFQGAMLDEASFVIAFHRPGQPPLGLSPKWLWYFDVYEDEV